MKEKKEPSVSVVIPTYGGSDSLKRTINSVLLQEYNFFNIIVVDDNNPNTIGRKKTEKIMKNYSNNSKIIYIKHSKNRNGAAARNTGVAATNAKYLCLLDDDDLFLPNRLLHQVQFLEKNNEYDACYCWRRTQSGEICGLLTGDLSKTLLDLSFTPTTSALMLTRNSYNSLNGFDESYRRHQDYEFLLRFFKKYKIGVVKEVLLDFVGNEINNQLKGKKLYNLKEQFFTQFLKEIEEIDRKNKGFKKQVYATHFADAFKELIRYGNFYLALKIYLKYGIKGGIKFWREFFKIIISRLKRV